MDIKLVLNISQPVSSNKSHQIIQGLNQTLLLASSICSRAYWCNRYILSNSQVNSVFTYLNLYGFKIHVNWLIGLWCVLCIRAFTMFHCNCRCMNILNIFPIGKISLSACRVTAMYQNKFTGQNLYLPFVKPFLPCCRRSYLFFASVCFS